MSKHTNEPMSDDEIFQAREGARLKLDAQDAEILRMHENAVAAMLNPELAEDVRVEALLITREWEDRDLFSEDYIDAWREILAMEDEDAAAAILADTDDGRFLRRNTPFSSEALNYQRG